MGGVAASVRLPRLHEQQGIWVPRVRTRQRKSRPLEQLLSFVLGPLPLVVPLAVRIGHIFSHFFLVGLVLEGSSACIVAGQPQALTL